MNNKEISFVTGANGFVGQALCSLLKSRNIIVHGSGRKTCSSSSPLWDYYQPLSLGDEPVDPSILNGVDTVYHLAATVHIHSPTQETTKEYFRVNTQGTQNLLNAAANACVQRFVYLSSVSVLGEGGERCLDESAPINCTTPYAQSKYEAEKQVLGFSNIPHRSVIRAPLIYGPNCPGNLNRMINMVIKGRFPPIPPLSNHRSMVHVEDLVQALYMAANMDNANGEVFHVTDGQDYTTTDIYQWIIAALNKQPPTWYTPMFILKALAKTGNMIGKVTGRDFIFSDKSLQKLVGSACYNSDKIRDSLGYRPKRQLKDSMQEIVDSLLQ